MYESEWNNERQRWEKPDGSFWDTKRLVWVQPEDENQPGVKGSRKSAKIAALAGVAAAAVLFAGSAVWEVSRDSDPGSGSASTSEDYEPYPGLSMEESFFVDDVERAGITGLGRHSTVEIGYDICADLGDGRSQESVANSLVRGSRAGQGSAAISLDAARAQVFSAELWLCPWPGPK